MVGLTIRGECRDEMEDRLDEVNNDLYRPVEGREGVRREGGLHPSDPS